MTIYATPFRRSDLEPTGPTTDSGFESLDQVVELMGDDYRLKTLRYVIYGGDDERVIYSDVKFGVDHFGNND